MKNSDVTDGRDVPQSPHLFGHSGGSGGCCLLNSSRNGAAFAGIAEIRAERPLAHLVDTAAILDGHVHARQVRRLTRENQFDLERFGKVEQLSA